MVLPYCACPGNKAWNEIRRKGTPITAYQTSSKARSNKVFPGLCSLEPFQMVDTINFATMLCTASFYTSLLASTAWATDTLHLQKYKIIPLSTINKVQLNKESSFLHTIESEVRILVRY
jgi:hypothetical protein